MIGSRGMWSRHAALLAVAVLVLGANVTFFFWYRSTMRERRTGLEERRAALEREVQSVEQEAVRLSTQKERLSSVSAAIQEFYGGRVGTSRETLALVVDEVHGLLKRSAIATGQIAYTTRPMTDLPLVEMVVTFGFKSDYPRFKMLLGQVETDPRWIVVRDIGLSRDPEGPGAVQVRMSLATYFSTREGPPPTPRPAAASSVPAGRRR